ncbi:MAG TPA: TIM44-like domain-containing protein [Candidatus Dormibacteraeota bacterium]|nr:TIM44-like domain-containing protein [Candidatus Dormibacteraeota bacterium]
MSAAPPADPAIGLGQIQAADPAFDLELFKRQAVQTFLAVKQAIQERDLTDVVDQLSDGVFDDLRFDVQSLEARGAIEHFDGLAPTQVLVAAAERGPAGDVITLRIQAVAMEYLGLAGGSTTAPGAPGVFTEFWTFTRPFDAVSPSVHRNECPTCGAPIDVDTGRICHYCKTLLPPPQAQTGWVVAAILPAQENQG